MWRVTVAAAVTAAAGCEDWRDTHGSLAHFSKSLS